MQYDFVNELGYLAIATRLKRISEAMVHSGRKMYKHLGENIEPNWYLIFKLLDKYEALSVTEMAAKLHFSHPSVITLVNKIEAAGYLTTSTDKKDSRKTIYRLSQKATDKLPHWEKIWEAGTVGVSRLFGEESTFMQDLEKLEIKLSQADFMSRTINELKNED